LWHHRMESRREQKRIERPHHMARYTASLFLPLALLLARTLLPPLVLILARKPWTRDRFILLG
jgi:hypothetical protein